MLDVCSSCRIQAPHRDGRPGCPRCGGPLTVLDQYGRAVGTMTAQTAPAAPRVWQPPRLRWVADRPVSARPAPRAPHRPPVSSQTPSYTDVPRWGLLDVPVAVDSDTAVDSRFAFAQVLRTAGWVFATAAVFHLIRYVIAIVNRDTPVSVWVDLASSTAVISAGLVALVAMVATLVVFVRWLMAGRAEAYASAGMLDPRPTWQVVILAAVPILNVIGAPILLAEAALCAPDSTRALDRVKKIATAWALVNLVALIALAYRTATLFSDRIQVAGDALAIVTLTFALSAVFAFWASSRLPAVLLDVEWSSRPAAARRLVAA